MNLCLPRCSSEFRIHAGGQPQTLELLDAGVKIEHCAIFGYVKFHAGGNVYMSL